MIYPVDSAIQCLNNRGLVITFNVKIILLPKQGGDAVTVTKKCSQNVHIFLVIIFMPYLEYDRFSSCYNVDLTWKINGIISNKTFSRKKTTEWWSWQIFIQTSKKNKDFTERKYFDAYGLQKASIYNSAINEEKSWQWIYWKPKRRFSWPNNEKLPREGKNHFLSE